MSFGINVQQTVTDAMNRGGAALEDWREIWPTIGELLRTSFKDTFDAEGRPRRWVDLADLTIERRRKGPGKGAAYKILQDSGRLFGSITESNHADFTEVLTADSMVMGSTVEYAAKHNYGHKGPPPTPRRAFLVVQPEDEQEIEETVSDWIELVMQ